MMLREHHLLKDNNQFLTVDFVCCVQSQQTPELLFTTAELVLYEEYNLSVWLWIYV